MTMATLTFDTLKFVETLKAHGVPEEQAKGIAEAFAEAFKDAQSESDVATKADIARLESRMETLELRLTVKLCTFIMLATGILIAVIKL
jgi:hypothetical protein